MTNDTIELLEIFQSNLGSSRAKCDSSGKKLWDRIEAAKLGKMDACLYAIELEHAVMEVVGGKRKADKLPIQPMARLIQYARTGSTANAKLKAEKE